MAFRFGLGALTSGARLFTAKRLRVRSLSSKTPQPRNWKADASPRWKGKADPAPYTALVPLTGTTTHGTIGTFVAKRDRLDEYIAAYKKHAFDVLLSHPSCKHYTLLKDEKNSTFYSLSVWTNWQDASAVMRSENFKEHIIAMSAQLGALADSPPTFKDLPVYCSTV